MLLVSMPSLHHSPLRQRGKNTLDTPSTDAARLCNFPPPLPTPSSQQYSAQQVTMHQHFRCAGCQQCTSGPDKVSWHQRSPATMQADVLSETQLATCVCVCHRACVFFWLHSVAADETQAGRLRLKCEQAHDIPRQCWVGSTLLCHHRHFRDDWIKKIEW